MKLVEILSRHQTFKKVVESNLVEQTQFLDKCGEYSIIINDIKLLCKALLEKSRKDIQHNISNIVTSALKEIKDTNDIEFIIDFEFKRNQPEAYLYVKKRGSKKDITNSYGGGITDIVSSILKLVFSHLLKIKGPIFVDEPGKWIDPYTSVRYVQFLKQLCNKFNLQMILITHKPEVSEVADRLIEVYIENGESVVKVE